MAFTAVRIRMREQGAIENRSRSGVDLPDHLHQRIERDWIVGIFLIWPNSIQPESLLSAGSPPLRRGVTPPNRRPTTWMRCVPMRKSVTPSEAAFSISDVTWMQFGLSLRRGC